MFSLTNYYFNSVEVLQWVSIRSWRWSSSFLGKPSLKELQSIT